MSELNIDSEGSGRIPIIKLFGQLLVPLQGDVTDHQASRLREDILLAIQKYGALGVVIDVSGLWIVDSHLCSVLAQLALASRLMGTRTVLSGVSPDIAVTLQTMGVGLEGMETALGLEEALELLGLQVTQRSIDSRRQELEAIVDDLVSVASTNPAHPGTRT